MIWTEHVVYIFDLELPKQHPNKSPIFQIWLQIYLFTSMIKVCNFFEIIELLET